VLLKRCEKSAGVPFCLRLETSAQNKDMEFPAGIPAVNKGQGESMDVADVCLFLASDLSRHVSGVELYVDGGFSLVR